MQDNMQSNKCSRYTLVWTSLEEHPCKQVDNQDFELLLKSLMAFVSIGGVSLNTSGIRKLTMDWYRIRSQEFM